MYIKVQLEMNTSGLVTPIGRAQPRNPAAAGTTVERAFAQRASLGARFASKERKRKLRQGLALPAPHSPSAGMAVPQARDHSCAVWPQKGKRAQKMKNDSNGDGWASGRPVRGVDGCSFVQGLRDFGQTGLFLDLRTTKTTRTTKTRNVDRSTFLRLRKTAGQRRDKYLDKNYGNSGIAWGNEYGSH
jgi:hypothetical protein